MIIVLLLVLLYVTYSLHEAAKEDQRGKEIFISGFALT